MLISTLFLYNGVGFGIFQEKSERGIKANRADDKEGTEVKVIPDLYQNMSGKSQDQNVLIVLSPWAVTHSNYLSCHGSMMMFQIHH